MRIRDLIHEGVCPNFPGPSLPVVLCHRDRSQLAAAQDLITEDLNIGAVQKVDLAGTRYLILWFVLSKPEGEHQKHWLIAD